MDRYVEPRRSSPTGSAMASSTPFAILPSSASRDGASRHEGYRTHRRTNGRTALVRAYPWRAHRRATAPRCCAHECQATPGTGPPASPNTVPHSEMLRLEVMSIAAFSSRWLTCAAPGSSGRYASPNSFGNKFRDWVRQAGLPEHCTGHGIRKAAATRAADNGATHTELMAMFGWLTEKEATRYTREANRRKLGRAGVTPLGQVTLEVPFRYSVRLNRKRVRPPRVSNQFLF